MNIRIWLDDRREYCCRPATDQRCITQPGGQVHEGAPKEGIGSSEAEALGRELNTLEVFNCEDTANKTTNSLGHNKQDGLTF